MAKKINAAEGFDCWAPWSLDCARIWGKQSGRGREGGHSSKVLDVDG